MPVKPQVYQGDEEILLREMNPNWKHPVDEEIAEDNEIAQREALRQQMMDGIADEIYGSAEGAGYLRAPNARGTGYLAPPNAAGGVLPLLPIALMASSILPALFGRGKGRKRGGMTHMKNPVHLTHSPNMSNASSFYRDLVHQSVSQGLGMKRFHKLFAGNKKLLNSMLNGKSGSGIVDELKMGHLLSPVIYSHLQKALKGTNVHPDKLMGLVEELPIMHKNVSGQTLSTGGSILGSLWNVAKGVLGKLGNMGSKIASNPRVQEIAKKGLNKAAEIAEKRLPDIAEIATNKLADYAEKKMAGDEPVDEDEDDYDEDAPKYSYLEKTRMRNAPKPPALPSTYKQPSMSEQLNRQKRGLNKQTTQKRTYAEDTELPSGRSDSNLRKNLVNQRRQKSLVPMEEPREAPKPLNRIIGYNRFGTPIYGEGKKKAFGGSWTVKLTRN